jgi:ABC-type multidrug transport system fused ATPase/permease subunit
MYILKLFIEFIKNYKITSIIYILCTILSYPLESILLPQIYSNFFKVLSKQRDINIFIKYLFIIILVQIIVYSSNAITTYQETYIIPEMNHFIINYVFKNILKKYENSSEELEIGKIITRLSIIPDHLKQFMIEFLVWIFPKILTMILINLYFFYLNWKLGLCSTIILIIFYFISLKLFFNCTDSSKKRHDIFEENNQILEDKLSNCVSIYSSGNLNNEIEKYNNDINKYTLKYKENLLCLSNVNIYSSIGMLLIFVLLNIFTTYLYIKKDITLTNLIAVFITIIYYIPCIVNINLSMPELISHIGALISVDDFVKDIYNTEIKNKNNIKKQYLKINNGNIIINNLNFGYNEKDILFNNFYLTIKNNEKIAIIGPSGNGKSTLIKLIMGYYKIPNGMIFIDNKDVNRFDLSDLRKQIGYVSQNSKLFNMSIFENIKYGNDACNEEIINLCKKINVDNIFKNLKDNYNTNVGIEGNNLSGGQRQIIHILRNILNNNKIIILDEPTTAIDKENNLNIINAIKELGKNKTIILITHDEQLLSIVNRVITLNSGKIIDDKYINNLK